MGANVSKTTSKITNTIANEIDQSSSASATAECSIKTGNIVMKNAKGCQVLNKNSCGASASAVIDATVNAAADAFSQATTAQKTKLLPGINASSTKQDIKNEISNVLKQKCQSNANVRNSILSQDIIIDGCENSSIQNINVGDAVAMCGIRAVMQAATTAGVKADTTQATGSVADAIGIGDIGGFGSMSTYGIISSASCSLCCCCIILIFLFFMFMK